MLLQMALFCSLHWSVPSNVNGTLTYLQNGNRVTDVENKLMVTRGGGIDIYTLLYIKWITNKDLLYSTGNYTQYLVITHHGKES